MTYYNIFALVYVFQQLDSSCDVSEELICGLDKITCVMYNKKHFVSVDALRHCLLTSKCRGETDDLTVNTNVDLSAMPLSKTCLIEHITKTNYQARI